MPLFAQFGSFAAPTVNGTDTVLSGLTTPKAIILWTTRQTAAGTAANGELYLGWATYDASTVQQSYTGMFDVDASSSSDTARLKGDTACLKGTSAATPGVDFELDLVSMDSTSVTLDWVDAPAAAIKVHYLVLGGSDLTAAKCGSISTTAVATVDVTVAASWGQPNLLLFGGGNPANADQNGNAQILLAAAKSDTSRIASIWGAADAAAQARNASWQKARAVLGLTAAIAQSAATADFEGDLSAVGSWPTDGFQVSWPDQPGAGSRVQWLALKGTFQSSIGTLTAPIAGTPPVSQDYNAGFPPTAALVWGGNLASAAGIDSTGADLGHWRIGATDGTTEGNGGLCGDDNADPTDTNKNWSETKGVQHYNQAIALQSEADLSFSGNNLNQSWNDIDTVARESCVLVLGSAAAAATSLVPPAFQDVSTLYKR